MTDEQLVEVGERLEELNIVGDNQVEAESTERRADALRQIGEERKVLSAYGSYLTSCYQRFMRTLLQKLPQRGKLVRPQ